MARRVYTEQVFDEHFGHLGEQDSPPFNVDDLSDEEGVNLYGNEDDEDNAYDDGA
jgi:hypothetical protein